MHVFRELLHTYSILVFTKLSTPAKYALSFLGFAFMKFCQDVKLSFAYHFRKYVKASRKEDTRAKNHKVDVTERIGQYFYNYSKALRCTFFGERKNMCSSKSCIIRSVLCYTVFQL